jgi:ubiquinone/menaquinone biosynthesis C-methylase UbiE
MLVDAPVLTFDVDWAPDYMIDFTADILRAANVRSTWFVTHESPALGRLRRHPELFELGIHPNFLPGSSHGDNPRRVLESCLAIVPEAQSFRTHSLVQSTPLLCEVMQSTELTIEASLFLPGQTAAQPFRFEWDGHALLRVPFHWEDDHEMASAAPRWEAGSGKRSGEIFNFHPIHVFLNSRDMSAYAGLKARFGHVTEIDRQSAEAAVQPGAGTQTLFIELVEKIRGTGDSARMVDLRERWAMAAGRKISHVAAGVVDGRGDVQRLESYRTAAHEDRAQQVRARYDALDASNVYATSRDFNLRELEIGFIREHAAGPDILDIGCGNGYTLISLARTMEGNLVGLDFSPNMIDGARTLTERFKADVLTRPVFETADVRRLPYPDGSFDTVISERLIFNLPSRADQEATIREVRRVLRPGGRYLMVEGNEDGLRRLNTVREHVGLEPIPTADSESFSSLKLEEGALAAWLEPLFEIADVRFFGTYYLISRVVHPLLVHPDQPRFDAPINAIARKVAEVIPDVGRLGHVTGYVLVARK